MSHATEIPFTLDNLAALKLAVQEHGGLWGEGVKTFKSYQDGLTCEHVIRLPDCGYEIGVTRAKNSETYALSWDTYGEGQKLLAKFGEGCKRLRQSYSTHKAMLFARSKGWMAQRVTLANGHTEVTLSGI